jgi:hypothetical protein
MKLVRWMAVWAAISAGVCLLLLVAAAFIVAAVQR